MKVFVTGGTGFIGKRLVDLLCSHHHEVYLLTRRTDYPEKDRVQQIKGNLTGNNTVIENSIGNCDVIIHCAGEIKNKALMYTLHVNGTQILLKTVLSIAKKQNRVIHWIQLSSVGVYGPPQGAASTERIITEMSPLNPIGEYEITKTKSDELVKQAAQSKMITYTIIRPSNVYAENMPNQSIKSLAKMIKLGMFFYIGKPGAIATYVHADDLVELMLLCATNKRAKNEVFNLSNDTLFEYVVEGLSEAINAKKVGLRLPEFIVRLFSRLILNFIQIPLTSKRIDALVLRTSYPFLKLEKQLNFTPRRSVPGTIGEVGITIN